MERYKKSKDKLKFTLNNQELKKGMNMIFLFPKHFVIISQYPFFNTYKKICKELLYNLFKNDLLEIPVEIQLYNLINFVPAPVKEKLNMSFFISDDLNEIISKNPNLVRIVILNCCNNKKSLYNEEEYVIRSKEK